MNKKIVLPSLFIFFACSGTAQQPAQDLLKSFDTISSSVDSNASFPAVQNAVGVLVPQQKKEEEPWWKRPFINMRAMWDDVPYEEKPRSAKREVGLVFTSVGASAVLTVLIMQVCSGK